MKKEENLLISEFYELKVEQLMNTKLWDISTIEQQAPIDNVLSILDGRAHLWVVNTKEDKELVGVITQHDVLQLLAPPRTYYNVFTLPKTYPHGNKGTAGDLMTLNPIICHADETILDALQKMIRHRVRRLPVLNDENKIVGELTLAHLIHKYYMATQYHSIVNDETQHSEQN